MTKRKKADAHESIKITQREISLPYSDAKPSEVTDVYWIYAMRKEGKISKVNVQKRKMAYIC